MVYYNCIKYLYTYICIYVHLNLIFNYSPEVFLDPPLYLLTVMFYLYSLFNTKLSNFFLQNEQENNIIIENEITKSFDFEFVTEDLLQLSPER